MSEKPSSLINFGSKCYLNSGIQAISACPDFVDKIDKLSNENKHLRKLALFNGLIKSTNEGKLLINIANNNIFEDWTKSGQQDSFELLSHVLNEVYEEMRMEKNVERGSVLEYFALGLPLRMQLKYDIICECGHKEGSPIQLDVALHLALPDHKSRDVHIQNLLYDQFKRDQIDDFPCENSNCNGKITWRELRLLALPYSICIHLQRLFWNGKIMVKNDVDVLFSNMITIKSDCFKKTDDVQLNDVQYYLKSVIVHYGWASFGHYICYKKVHDTWYYTSDTDIHRVTAQEVFSCNPYILFYEKESEWQVSPTIIEVDQNLNMFINALSSKVFISWLNKISADNDSLMIKRLLYLTKLANGDITRDRTFEEAELKGWSNKKDVHGTARDIVNEVSEETAMEFPLLFMVRCTITCSCGMSILNQNSSDVMLDITIPESLRHRMLKLQDLIDHHFSVNRPMRSGYMDHKCKQTLITLKLKSPLPDMFCIHLHRWPGDECDDRIILDNNIFMRDSFIEEVEHNEYSQIKGREYFLKSVIGTCNGRMCCFRNYNGSFYKIKRHNVEITAPEQSMDCDHCILFYDSDRCTFTSSSSLYNSSTKYLQMYLDSSVKREFKTMNVPLVVPVVIKINSHLNSFIHAISSCDHFIAELEEIYEYNKSYNIEKLLYLIEEANGRSMRSTNDLEKYVKDWYDKIESVEEVLAKVLKMNKNNDLLQYCFVKVTSPTSNLQMLINDQCSAFCKSLTKTICVKVASTNYEKMTFTETIFFSIKNENITQSKDVLVPLQVKDQVYTLQSVITEQGSCCYRKVEHNWYQVTKTSSKKVSFNDVLKCKVFILFYESQDLITFDNPLSCVLHSLSCCSSIIQWLKTMKNRKKMIKGRLISDMMNIIKGQTLDVTREKKVYRWNDDHFCDIYQLLKTMLTDLEEEIKAESENEESSLTNDIHIPMRITIEERIKCSGGKGSISEMKNKVILNINLPNVINYKDKVTIQQLLEKYFEDKPFEDGDPKEYKHSSLMKHKCKLLVEPYPSIIVIHVNIFYVKNGESLKYTNNVKPSEKIKIPTTLRTREYKLKSVIEHYGKPSSDQYCCFKEINGEWVYVKDENVVGLSLKEVLEIEPYIAVYEVDPDSDNISNDNDSKEASNLYEASVTTLRNNEAMVEESCTSTFHNTTLQSTQPTTTPIVIISFECTSNKTFSNFLRSILNCPKFITNMKSLIDKSLKSSEYDSLFNEAYEITEAQRGTLVIKDTQGPYKTIIEPFIEILYEYCADLVQEKCMKEWNFPLVIFNVGYKGEVLESKQPIMFGVNISNGEEVSIQQMWDNYFELYSNASSGIIMLQYKDSQNQIKRLFQGRFPDTICFHLSLLFMMTLSISKSFTLLIRNNLCQHSTTDNTKCSISTDGINSFCCRKMILKSVIDINNECYVMENNQWYMNKESGDIQIINEDDLHQKKLRILIYE